MPFRSDGTYSFVYEESRANRVPSNQRTPKPLSASTKKLFQAIENANLEDFKQAIAKGADVNAFDEGCTPLMTIVTNLSVCPRMETEKKYHSMVRLLLLDQNINVNICEQINDNTVLHLAMCFQQKKTLQLLLSHPNINTNITNKKSQSPSECARQNRAEHLIIEIQKAQKGKQLLTALSRNIYLAKTLLNQDLNPNCWERNKNGEIETPLSLIIKSCLQTITRDKEEVLTKLLKHKELDFSQIKQIQAIEKNLRLKQIITQTITEQLTDVINRKDLDDVKKLVEDNCFMNYAVVIAALGDVNNPTEPIKKYLNEKFPVSVNDTEEFVQELVDGLEKAKAQLAKKEKELSDARQELNKRNDEIGKRQNRILELERELHHAKIRLAKGGIERSAEDNCFMSPTIVTAALGNVNKKFPASAERPLASTDSTPVGFEQIVPKLVDELESVQAQLAEKEKELDDTRQELNKRNNEIREQQNRISELKRELDQAKAQPTEKNRKLNNTREESNERVHQKSDGRANSPGGKQNNYALTFFILCGICAGGACLTIVDYPEISAGLAAVALGLFLVGYFLYKGDEKDIGPGSATDNPQVYLFRGPAEEQAKRL
ncbi:MAG: Chromosome partition protein Smc [Wolbachia endosymbiont of Ctenocephalides felis wCfeF]|nr:MAG: Chromosome partition protein Smc [Wolbachia endosymbiont of Ctenocephalides felis wCfeF]